MYESPKIQGGLSQGPGSHSFAMSSSGRRGLGIRVSVGGQNSNFNSCQQQPQLHQSIHTDQAFVSFPPSPLSPPYALILPLKTPIPAAWSAAELSSFPPVSGY